MAPVYHVNANEAERYIDANLLRSPLNKRNFSGGCMLLIHNIMIKVLLVIVLVDLHEN